jgi:multiple sugar transport system substrate-binding protein
VHPAYRQKAGTRGGQPRGVDSSDSLFSFLALVVAYNVRLVDDDGKLLVDAADVWPGLVRALKDYTDLYLSGCALPSSTS